MALGDWCGLRRWLELRDSRSSSSRLRILIEHVQEPFRTLLGGSFGLLQDGLDDPTHYMSFQLSDVSLVKGDFVVRREWSASLQNNTSRLIAADLADLAACLKVIASCRQSECLDLH